MSKVVVIIRKGLDKRSLFLFLIKKSIFGVLVFPAVSPKCQVTFY